MTSDRKIAANRRNAKKSTGPRTEAGRRHSRRNALQHGLAVAIGSQPSFREDIEALAKALVGDGGQPNEFARQVAEAELDLLRIRKIRASQLNAAVGNPGAPSEAYAELGESLAKLERYERRAYSRRKRALGALIS
ncbi:MAG: hypothetical protein E7813_11515 [Bradyrhizobium sp.]|uniref:hypothetical protein n=1 Tax=Bradyrhizobium sp. TaxID=376 RepID=UPI00121CDC06|nr:hypothetical protein [Bradyrhizobium sp.]THD68256.1 MAG: hypothetical protein E7813_11515 [Bradyrhizobium sp.]